MADNRTTDAHPTAPSRDSEGNAMQDRQEHKGDGSEVCCQTTSHGGMWAASVGDLPQDVAWQEGLLEGFDPYADDYDADGEL